MNYVAPLRLLLTFALLSPVAKSRTADGKPVAVLVAGRPSHGPGEHEHNAGILLFAKCLAQGAPYLIVKTHLSGDWPNTGELAEADTLVVYCDGGENHLLLKDNRLSQVAAEAKRGMGLVLVHYAVEFPVGKGSAEALGLVGGYFEANWSVNPVWHADYRELPTHPVTRGVHPFESTDEWYFHMRFNERGGALTPILSAVPPASSMSRPDGDHSGNPTVRREVSEGKAQTMSWAYERPDGGRGFAFAGGHYHKDWAMPDQRKLVLNAILWTAQLPVPAGGVESTLTDDDLKANLDKKAPRKSNPVAAAAPSAPFSSDSPPEIVPTSLFTVPDGFEVTVWAHTPMVRNPTNIDMDAQGRVWIAEGVNYRKHTDRQPAGDRIVVLEDSNGGGRADKASVFTQEPGMNAPLGIAVIDDQVIVSCAPDLIVYTNPSHGARFDPRLGKREILLTGFNGRNHDHGLHSVIFGPDGLWYFSEGNVGALFTDRSGKTFRVGGPYDPVSPFSPDVYSWRPSEIAGAPSDDGHVYTGGFAVRMHPDGTKAEIIGYNFRNSYEQCVTSFGDVFQGDNDDPPACRTSFLMEYGNAGFFSRDGSRSWQADRRPGQPTATAEWRQDDPGTMPAGDVYGAGAPTGIVSYEGDLFGDKWRGMILLGEAGRNTVYGYFPKAEGAGYELKRFRFLTTNQSEQFGGLDSQGGKISNELRTWFRPSDVAVGPDGAIYVADWFDPRVGGHQDLDDKTAGAIYRIAPKGFKSVIPKFDLSTTEGQIEALKSPAINVRASGFLRLRSQGAGAVGPVSSLLSDRNPFIRARAVWLLAQLGDAGLAQAKAQLRSADPMMRITAFRALRASNHEFLGAARALATDPSPAVRREVALSLRDVPFEGSKDILLSLAGGYDGLDRAYLEAWGTGCSGKETAIYEALASQEGQKDPEKWTARYSSLVWRLTPPAAAKEFAARASSTRLRPADRLAAVTALGFIPTAEAANAMLELAEHGLDDVKTQAIWWLLNYKDSRWKAFGTAQAMKERGIYDPDKVTISEMIVPEAAPTKLPSAKIIAAMTGDPAHGAAVAQSCQLCHRIRDKGIDYAPNLTGFANRETTAVVIAAILDPSADIAHGFDGTEVTLRDGKKVDGLVQSEGDPMVIQSMGGLRQMIPKNRIRSRRPLVRSLMLSADQLGLSAQDVADVVAYLKTQTEASVP